MEETIRWGCDHDVYLRLIDHATVMSFMPVVVSRDNIPDSAEKSSMTTGLTGESHLKPHPDYA
jgi:hypothetical protein